MEKTNFLAIPSIVKCDRTKERFQGKRAVRKPRVDEYQRQNENFMGENKLFVGLNQGGNLHISGLNADLGGFR